MTVLIKNRFIEIRKQDVVWGFDIGFVHHRMLGGLRLCAMVGSYMIYIIIKEDREDDVWIG